MNRFLLALSLALGITCTWYAHAHADGSAGVDAGITATAGSGLAAAPVLVPVPVVVPDPTAAPLDAASALAKLYHSGAWIALVILAAFFALKVLESRVGWFTVGKRKAYVAAAVGGLAILAAPASQGTTPNLPMLIAALGASLTLLTHPQPPSS